MPAQNVASRTERISGGQSFCAVVLFMLGTTWIFVPGAAMGRDAWIACLMGLASGLLLFLLYQRLQALFPGQTLIQWLPRLCGPFLGSTLGVIYSLYFLYICARNLRDIAELLRLSFLYRTPVLAITLLQTTVVGLAAYYGFEVSTRVKQLLLPVVLLLLGLVSLGLWWRRYPLHLFPILEYGVGPVWYHSFPAITTVPYGELIVFLVYGAFVRGSPKKAMLAGVLTGGGLLTFIAFLAVLVIGPANLANSALPYYTLVRAITFGDVVQRLDGVIVPMLAFCAYAKASTMLIGASYGIAQMNGAKRPGILAFYMAFLAAAWGSAMAIDFGQHLHSGLEIVPYALHIPLQVLIPLLLWLLAEVRTRFRPIQRPPKPLDKDTPSGWCRVLTLILTVLFWIPTLFPAWLEKSYFTQVVLRPIGHLVGEPVVRLLGGHPMKD